MKPGRRGGWLMPLYRLLQQLPEETRQRLFPALHRGRREVIQEVHQGLIHEVLRTLRTPSGFAPPFRDPALGACFRDPRWSRVRCSVLTHSWNRLLEHHGLHGTLARHTTELRADPAIADRSGVVRDFSILGISDESGRPEIYVREFSGTSVGRKWQVSTSGGSNPRWRGDGRAMFYLAGDGTVMQVDVNTSAGFQAVTLGQRILRAETAALAAISIVQSRLGELG